MVCCLRFHVLWMNYVACVMVTAHFHDVVGDLFDHNVQNSDSDLVPSCFTRILIGLTRRLLLCFVLGSLAALIHLQFVLEL